MYNIYFYEGYFIDYENQKFIDLGFKNPPNPAFEYEEYCVSYHSYAINNGAVPIIETLNDYEGVQVNYILKISVSEVGENIYITILMKKTISGKEVVFSTIIDTNGNIILPVTHEILVADREKITYSFGYYYIQTPYTYSGGLCLAQKADTELLGYIDTTGSFVIDAVYESATDFHETENGAIAVVNRNTVIDTNGTVLFTADDVAAKLNASNK